MAGYGYNDNPLMQYLRQYVPQQPETPQAEPTKAGGTSTYEINSKSELSYIEPDTSGRKQIVDCPSEKKIYVGRYNHFKKAMDWRSYIAEEDLPTAPEANADMAKIAEALVIVGGKLDAMQSELQALKEKPFDNGRLPNGQFKKKGDA